MIEIADKILKLQLEYSQITNFFGYWYPLQWLYVEMVKKKGIEPIGDIGQTEKTRYWNLTEGERWKRICQVQALYIYEQLKTEK